MEEACLANMCRNLRCALLKGTVSLSFQSRFSLWLSSVPWNCCLEEITLTWALRPLSRSDCVIFPCMLGEGDNSLFTAEQKKTTRHKWGLTVSWSTIGWSQMRSDCPELSGDLCSMQNALSPRSVPTGSELRRPRPWGHGFECSQSRALGCGTRFLLTTITFF